MTADIDENFRAALRELEDFLGGVPRERRAELVLPFASRWVLPTTGFDLARLQHEAETLVQATALSERILDGYVDQVAWWVGQRMLLDDVEEPDAETAAARLAAVRDELAMRATIVEDEGFLRIADGIRRVLEETAGGEPPADLLWSALALRIAETAV